MKKDNKEKTKKGANHKQTLNLPLSTKISVQIIDNMYSDLYKSLIFKLYVKSLIHNKALTLKTIYELEIFVKKIKFVIETHNIDNLSEAENFMINEETEIEVTFLDNALDNLKLESIGDLPKFDKIEFLRKNCENFYEYKNENVELIGMEDEFNKIKAVINYNLFEDVNENYLQTGKSIPKKFTYKGVILSGPNGIGKSNFIKYIVKEYYNKITFFDLNFKTLMLEKSNLEIEEIIKNTFKYAKLMMPSVVVIEDIDRFFTKSEEDQVINFDDKKTKLLYCLIHEIENLWHSIIEEKVNKITEKNGDATKTPMANPDKNKVLIVSSCANIDKIDIELRKPGNLDYLISLNPPNQPIRKKLFTHFSQFFNNILYEEDLEILADKSHGFVPTDIIQIFKDCLLTMISNKQTVITKEILEKSLKEIKPINLKEIILDVPKVLWSDIGGNKESIMRIRQSIEWPLKNPEAFKRIGITSPNGILLYGPPGCSKTMIAKALATESGLNFFAVKGPELFSKYVGDTEKAIRDLFKKARISSPSIIFFDEIDAMANERGSDSVVSDKVLCQLLNEMDGIEGREKVVVMGATNRPDILDKALIRPGRFDRLIYIPPPDVEARKEIFRINIAKMQVEENINLDELAETTKSFSGAEINLICREAGMLAITRDIDAAKIEYDDFVKSIKNIKPIITQSMLNYFEKFGEKIKI